MSVEMFKVSDLWRMPCDDFNEWRATNDLPVLYDFFLQRLPDFSIWATEFGVNRDTFSRTIPTATLLLGPTVLTLVENKSESERFLRFWPSTVELDEYVRRCNLNGRPVPVLKSVVPYLLWGANRFGRKDFIPHSGVKVSGIVFDSWSAVNLPELCRASIFRDFAVLKLGGYRVEFDLSGRNLDFADLDYLVVTGDSHANKSTHVQFSSCRNMNIANADMAFYEFRKCWMADFVCSRSNLYSMNFVDCESLNASFAVSKLKKIRFERCGATFDFDHCDLIDVIYEPAEITRFYLLATEVYRQLRTAYQSCGKRHEASEAYFQERTLERKALGKPYYELNWEQMFPPKKTGESPKEVLGKWRKREYDNRNARRKMLQIGMFHVRLWLIPKYAIIAVKFKVRYLISLMEALVWGYGERPSRIIATAFGLLTTYSFVFYGLLNKGAATNVSFVDCAYLSVATFTTLGYGTPTTDLMKMVCGSEAAIGAFTLGLFVAGFANRSRY